MVNIFAVDQDPEKAARALYDKHIVKMPIESLQMLSSVWRYYKGVEVHNVTSVYQSWKSQTKEFKKPRTMLMVPEKAECLLGNGKVWTSFYLEAHKNHPCTIWAKSNKSNYNWLVDHTIFLLDEYTRRYGKASIANSMIKKFLKPPSNIPDGELESFNLAMQHHPECIVENDPILSYRNYYNKKPELVSQTMCWTKSQPPKWFNGPYKTK